MAFTEDKTAQFKIVSVDGGRGSGVQNLLIPPADSGFSVAQETTVKKILVD